MVTYGSNFFFENNHRGCTFINKTPCAVARLRYNVIMSNAQGEMEMEKRIETANKIADSLNESDIKAKVWTNKDRALVRIYLTCYGKNCGHISVDDSGVDVSRVTGGRNAYSCRKVVESLGY